MKRINLRKLNAIFTAICLLFIVNIRVYAFSFSKSSIKPLNAPIDLSAHGSITVRLEDADNKPITGGNVSLLQIASVVNVDGNDSYQFTEIFKNSGLVLDNLKQTSFATGAAEFASSNYLSGTILDIDANGCAVYSDLAVGIYLITQPESNEVWYPFQPYIVTIPLNDSGTYIYDVDSFPKMEPLTPITGTPTPTPGGNTPTPTPSSTPTPGGATPTSTPTPGNVTPTSTPPPQDTPTPTPDDLTGGGSINTPDNSTPTPTPTGTITGGGKTDLPQTGQLNWPIPILAFAGMLLIILGYAIYRSSINDKREK